MTNDDLYEIEKLLNEEINEAMEHKRLTSRKRKWREIENFKEIQKLNQELLEYS